MDAGKRDGVVLPAGERAAAIVAEISGEGVAVCVAGDAGAIGTEEFLECAYVTDIVARKSKSKIKQ